MIDEVGAKRVVLDTLEALFAGLPNEAILRAELRRLFRWLKDKGVTAVITGEQGDEHAHPPRPGGVRQRLRDLPRPSRHQPGRHAPAAGRQVPRLRPRHQRVPDHDRRARPVASADQFAGAGLPGGQRSASRPASTASTRCWAARATTAAAASWSRAPPARARAAWPPPSPTAPARRGERCLYFSFEESPSADHAQHGLDRLRPEPVGVARGCCSSTRCARRSTAWSSTW